MKKELKQKWVYALRSGKYQQGYSKLRTIDEKYCCLGVLYDVSGQKWKENKDFGCYQTTAAFYGVLGKIGRNMGLDEQQEIALITMNDKKDSFKDIADWIERFI